MKEVADKYHSFFSPQPFAIAGFFAPQTILQLLWLYKLVRLANSPTSAASQGSDMARYAGTFILGNVAIGVWMVFWNNERLDLSHACVVVNSLSQLWFVTTQLTPMTSSNALTHVVAKMFAGIGVLDLLDNGASWLYPGVLSPPHKTLLSLLTAVGFVGGALVSDPIMSASLAYDAFALAAGQKRDLDWHNLLLGLGGVTGAIAAFKGYQLRDVLASVFYAH